MSERKSAAEPEAAPPPALLMTVADYNPSVLQLVTLPNFILTWALLFKDTEPALRDAFELEDELELTDELKQAFSHSLAAANVTLSWISGGWSHEFVEILYAAAEERGLPTSLTTLVLGAETIYSPFALRAFYETLVEILQWEHRTRPGSDAQVLVGAKRHYFGVGGSLDDFVEMARGGGFVVEQLAEETDGVRRGVVQCRLAAP